MSKSKTKLEIATNEVLSLTSLVNSKINELGTCDEVLYDSLISIQTQFDAIRNVPSDKMHQYEKIKEVCIAWKQHVDKINEDYIVAQKANVGMGAAGASAGAGIAFFGPTVAMGIATTYGVASTGTAIATLHGAAATNAALAWLGGGTLAAGGGGMSAGSALLGLAGPVGWTIAGLTILSSVLLFWKAKSNKKKLENIFLMVSNRDKKSYELALLELNERINHIKNEVSFIHTAVKDIATFGLDYNKMTEEQQYRLGSYVNLMNASIQLLTNPIHGLQPKYSERDFDIFIDQSPQAQWLSTDINNKKNMVVYMANFLYMIDTDESDRKLLSKSFIKNKEFIEKTGFDKDSINLELFNVVDKALEYSYSKGNK